MALNTGLNTGMYVGRIWDENVAGPTPSTELLEVGCLQANGFPAGVEVCDSMVHGAPYPAVTNFGATSVGTLAIRRFLRPVSYKKMPDLLLPDELLDGGSPKAVS
jgi:hypothetical protein